MKIVTLTLAAAFDIHCEAEGITVNHENIATVTDYDAGGKGVNISRALKSFGVDNTAVVVVGEDNQAEFVKRLENENISFQTVAIKGRIRENITIHTSDGRETRISFKSAPAPENLLCEISEITDSLCDGDTVLTFTGRLPEGVSLDSAKCYIKELKSRGVRIVLDSRSFALADMLEVKPYLIKPNEEEISAYMGMQISDFASAAEAALKLNSDGIENVMISLGEKGALLCRDGAVYTAAAPRIKAVSTVGAGDSSIAGFLYALSFGENYSVALKTAVAFGSAACLTAGTNPPERESVEKLLSQIR